MKKPTPIIMFLLILFATSVSAAYTGVQTFNADISSFVAKSYKCTDSSCNAVNLYETEGPSSTNVLNYAGSAGATNHDWYVLFFYDDNNCHVPYTWWTEVWGPGDFNMGTTNLDFYKQDKDHCGANVRNMDQSATVVQLGQAVTVTADIQSAWIINGDKPKYIPPELDPYYNSKVDLYFTVFNDDYSQTLHEEHEQILINWNEWFYPSYDWVPTQPGTYHLRIWTKMDNDCRCEGSNLKWMEVTITVPAPPFCGDSICNDGNSKTCEPNGASKDDICTNNVDTGNLANGVCRTTGNDACTYCGDGVKQSSEQCDDGNNANGDGCSSACHIEEGCLDGNKKDVNGNLLEDWTISIKEKGQPDSSSLVTETDGNGYYKFRALTPGKTYVVSETMKEGWKVAPGYSISYEIQVSPGQVCREQDFVNELIPYCGDGHINPGEECDDGNENNNDACRNDCTLPYCGDHIVDSDESCDDGNENNNDGCRNDCTYPYCGDGILDAGEECDDGNENNNDGCTNACNIENGCITGAKRDQDMTGLEGWTIHLKEAGEPDSSSITVVTDHTGYFEFTNLPFGSYVIWEEMQEGWEPITDERLEETIDSTVCEHVLFKNTLSCVDECELGNYCSEGALWECGNFDEDICLEKRLKEDCSFVEYSDSYDSCEESYSKKYRDITTGFCNSEELACDAHTRTEWLSEENCAFEQCETQEACEGNSVSSITECNIGYCNEHSGLCATRTQRNETLTDCGQDSVNEYCNGENIVREEETKACVEENNQASCVAGSSVTIVEECGPDSCTEFTDMDIYTKEYVYDEESCQVSEYLYCANDGNVYDICIGDILLQPYCAGNDHEVEQFDCSKLSGCQEFDVEECVHCEDEQGLCNGHKCKKKGAAYRQYTCGDGACQYTETEMVDIDHDYRDDQYCDDCIDVDKDGACDDVDTCPGISNPTQVDSDNDGYGNACDDDRDGDGYPAGNDCNDWNKEIHPNAEEVKNNDRDDDCSPETLDKGKYTPRQALYVDMAYDESLIKSGEEFLVSVSVTNTYSMTLKNVKIMLIAPGYQEKAVAIEENLEKGETVTKIFKLTMPNDIGGYEYLRAAVSTDSLKRVVYRELKLPQ